MKKDHRLIEDFIPIKEISQESAREKSIRKGHISTLHLWWARRPLVAARAAVFAALIPAPENAQERKDLANMMIDLCKWEVEEDTIKKARNAILEAQRDRLNLSLDTPFENVPSPKVLDMFAGGGAIPLEALRLGCETFAIDLNPVAHIIELCTLVYPQKYGKMLANEVEKWGNWVIEKVKAEIGDLYPRIALTPAPLPLGEGYKTPLLPREKGLGDEGNLSKLAGKQRQIPRVLLERARELRKEQTTAEKILWECLRNRQLSGKKFRRQHNIGNYIVDFYCHEAHLVIEVDGEIHQKQQLEDENRENWLKEQGFEVLRFNNAEVFDQIEMVLGRILDAIEPITIEPKQLSLFSDFTSGPSPLAPLPEGEGNKTNNTHPEGEGNKTHPEGEGNKTNKTPLLPREKGSGDEGLTPVAYLWTRTVKCPNPACGASVPLVRQTWLCKKSKKYVALKVIPNNKTKKVDFKVVESSTAKGLGFDPEAGSSRGNSTCRHCGTTFKNDYVKTEGKAGRIGQELMAIVCTTPGAKGKTYLSATDYQKYIPNDTAILQRLDNLCAETGLTIPNEPVFSGDTRAFFTHLYGLDNFGKLFTPRQLLSLMTFVKWVRLAHQEMLDQSIEKDLAKAIATYLGIMCDRLSDYNSSLTKWTNTGEKIGNTFSRQALPMVWDFPEINPLGNASGNVYRALEWITLFINQEANNRSFLIEQNPNSSLITEEKGVKQFQNHTDILGESLESVDKNKKENTAHNDQDENTTHNDSQEKKNKSKPNYGGASQICRLAALRGVETLALSLLWVMFLQKRDAPNYGKLYRASAMAIPLEKESLDTIITDPPYFDSVPYADLSDFFYVWLKRSIGHLYPEHLSGQLTPKKNEAIMEPSRHGGDKKKAAKAYEEMMHQAFCEANRVLKNDGIMAVVYAHKTTAGWSTLIDSLRRAGFTITEAWPLDTEMAARLRGQNSAALASSIFLIARKRTTSEVGDYAMDVQPQLKEIIQERVKTLIENDVSGADLVIACVGAGLRAYTQYETVELPNGEELDASSFLDEVQKEVAETILKEVLGCDQKGVSAVDKPTQYYILARYEYGEAIVEFDEANTLARGVGVELDGAGGLTDGKNALVSKDKNKIRLKNYQERGKDEDLGILQMEKQQEFNKNPQILGTTPTLIDILHRLLWLSEHKPAEINNYLTLAQPDAAKLRLVAQSLAGRALTPNHLTLNLSPEEEPEETSQRSEEQKAIDTLLASWKRIIEDNLFTRGG